MSSIDDRARELAQQLPSGNVDSARLTVLDAEYRRLWTGIVEAGQRVARADKARTAALSQIGTLIAEGRRLRDAYGRAMPSLRITDTAETIGLSRPTLYSAMNRAFTGDDEDPASWSDQRLAAAVLDGLLSNREQIENEFRVRFPAIMALADAAVIVAQAARKRGELDPDDWLDAPAAADDLNQAWREKIQAIADGRAEPSGAVPAPGPGMW